MKNKNGKFVHVGRKDNLLVHSNAEKTEATKFETAVKGLSAVRACLVVGHHRPRPALLAEPDWSNLNARVDGEARLRGALWEVVMGVNAKVMIALDVNQQIWGLCRIAAIILFSVGRNFTNCKRRYFHSSEGTGWN